MDNEEICFTIIQFALKMSVHPNTIRRAIKNGKIQAINMGSGVKKIYRIPSSEIGRMALFDLEEIFNRKKD